MPDPPPPTLLSQTAISLLSGAIAGTTVDTTLFPLDTLKTRLQSPQGFLASGGFRQIYSGLGPVVLFSAPSAALFFVTYDTTKRLHPLTSLTGTHMLAASLGELSACLVRVPTEVLKQRAQAKQHRTAREAFWEIWGLRRKRGWGTVVKELYRGGGITILREIPFTVIQFPLWESAKTVWGRRKMSQHVTPLESAVLGSVSGAVAALITTPLDVLKTRIMLSRRHISGGGAEKGSVWEVLRGIVREEGVGVLMRGWAPRVMWISIGGAVFLGAYDAAREVLEAL